MAGITSYTPNKEEVLRQEMIKISNIMVSKWIEYIDKKMEHNKLSAKILADTTLEGDKSE